MPSFSYHRLKWLTHSYRSACGVAVDQYDCDRPNRNFKLTLNLGHTLLLKIHTKFWSVQFQGYTNGHLRNLVSDLPPPSLPLPPLPLNRNEDGYFAHRRITIYDDPREPIDPPRRNQFHTRGIYHSTPTLEFVRPSRTSYYYDVRDNFRW